MYYIRITYFVEGYSLVNLRNIRNKKRSQRKVKIYDFLFFCMHRNLRILHDAEKKMRHRVTSIVGKKL